MQIVIQTIEGTFLVPTEKQAELIRWLESNAVKAGATRQVKEQQTGTNFYAGQQLLSEDKGKEF
jgi:hypothetical protein